MTDPVQKTTPIRPVNNPVRPDYVTRGYRPDDQKSITTIPVSTKLLREAHAVMRACGWHLAPASDASDDPTLAIAAAEIEEAFRDLTKGTAP